MKSQQKYEFSKDSLVFAKLRGFPYWPAKVLSIEEKYKNVIRYQVKFFVSNDTSSVKQDDMCHYFENKHNYPLESVALKHKEEFKLALQEIKKEWESNQRLNTSATKLSKSKLVKTPQSNPLSNQTVTPKTPSISPPDTDTPCSTPLGVTPHPETSAENLGDNTTVKTTCTNMDTIESQNSDEYHLIILKQELSKLKLENLNLQSTINILQSDNTKLEKELLDQKKINQNCFHCFPVLQSQEPKSPRNRPNSSTPTSYHYNSTFASTNMYSVLEDTPQNEPEVRSITLKKQRIVSKSTKYPQQHFTTSRDAEGAGTRGTTPMKSKNKLLVLADSHGKSLGPLIQQKTISTSVTSFVRPGAKLDLVVQEIGKLSKDLSKEDHILVIGGTNNVQVSETSLFIDEFKKLIEDSQHTNLILATLPIRHDMPQLDLDIISTNSELEKMADKYLNVNILPLHLLPRQYFTSHGLHFNKKGKCKIAQAVANLLAGNNRKKTNIVSDESEVLKDLFPSNNLNVIEGDMSEIMDKLKTNPSVGLAHSISSDYDHPRHMSAGVAVTFRKMFGRPDFSNQIDGKLTSQQIPYGATVYSIVTKSEFYGKPSKQNYDLAFNQLTRHFKQRGLKMLLCSPMGCVRDHIQLDHFVENILKFQSITKAKVCIVSYNQESRRVLRNGLSHPDFLRQLKDKIRKCTSETGNPTTPSASTTLTLPQSSELVDSTVQKQSICESSDIAVCVKSDNVTLNLNSSPILPKSPI